jgi:Activator of Hsp90 ATPase homolog 1-like protein
MKNKNFTTTLIVDQTPEQVFNVVRNVRSWWSGYYSEEIKGDTEKLNDEFSFRAGGGAHYSRQKLIEVIPNKKVVWLVTDSKLDFLEKKDEWTGTKIIFDISTKVNKTQLVFTHDGLMPEIECYNSCAPAWSQYLHNKLLPLITSGKGNTDKK